MINKIMALWQKSPDVEKDAVVCAAPVKGEKWLLDIGTSDPFPPKYPPVRILDVKDGWVRYWMGSLFDDERKPIDQFMRMYKKVGQ